ncbi:fatty acid elongase, putative [Trypanosoma equiperdum]|uniref:Elongation of fatty acids protein n=1 Tax=Trypanosoma equiperdum TaxID=5694 RepID=A0A1G4IDR2_TRYEQ|nr:fatty acid elongase, putative [Trypanosoma equiperdum]
MFPYVTDYSGFAIRKWMIDNVDVAGFLCLLYLGLVWKGPGVVKSLREKNLINATLLQGVFIMWNLFLSTFSVIGMIVVVPAAIAHISNKGLVPALCERDVNMIYDSPVGFWVGVFALSKIPELFDTVLLVLQGKQPPFLHWYHHTTVLIFSWQSYCEGSSTIFVFVAMNLTVHAVMYFYFAMCASGFKAIMRTIAPVITIMQILQMIVGSAVTMYSAYVLYNPQPDGPQTCNVTKASARMGVVMYLSYLYLFAALFVESYLKPKKRTEKSK